MTLLLCLLIFLPKILIGFVIASFLWRDADLSAFALKLGVGLPLGFAISASLFFLAALFGIPPSTYSRIEFWITIFLVGAVIIWQARCFRHKPWKINAFSPEDIWNVGIVLIGAALSVGAFLYYARLHPYGFEDAWSIWNLTPRFIYRADSADILLNQQLYPRFHPDYPVELGLNVAWGWLVMQSETTRLPIAVALLVNVSVALVLWAALRKWKGSLASAFGTLVLLMSPNLSSAISQYADILLSMHMLACAALFHNHLRTNKNGLLILAGFLAGSAAWVKNEGLLFLAVLTVICVFSTWKRDSRWQQLKLFFIGSLPALGIVLLYKTITNVQNDLFTVTNSFALQILEVQRWLIIGQSFLSYLVRHGNWPISALIILAVYMVLVGLDRKEVNRMWWLLATIVGQLIGYYFIYLITPHDLSLHIKTSMDRLVSHIYPLLIFWIFMIAQPPQLFSDSSNTNPPARSNRNGW